MTRHVKGQVRLLEIHINLFYLFFTGKNGRRVSSWKSNEYKLWEFSITYFSSELELTH